LGFLPVEAKKLGENRGAYNFVIYLKSYLPYELFPKSLLFKNKFIQLNKKGLGRMLPSPFS
jgi:hypothetical protein